MNWLHGLGKFTIYSIAILACLIFVTGCKKEPTCSCAGKPDCFTKTFIVGGFQEELAHCAIWGDGQSCCLVEGREEA